MTEDSYDLDNQIRKGNQELEERRKDYEDLEPEEDYLDYESEEEDEE